MKAIGYVRVSTDRQAELRVSLEAREARIRAMATLHGAELLEVIVDGRESAKNLNRPGLQRLLNFGGQRQSRGGDYCQTRPAHAVREGPLQPAGNLREAQRRLGLGCGIARHGLV